jgi:hypothetical protein
VRSNGEGKPIVAIDIDGTMADYHGYFLKFAELYLGKSMPAADQINPGKPLHRHMGISKPTYREVKLAYRQGGMKRSMPMLQGSREIVKAVRRTPSGKVEIGVDEWVPGLGCERWVCTTRPYLRLDNIDPDTREWLRRNGIVYDALLFDSVGGDSKYQELWRQAGDRVVCALEDLPEQAVRAQRAGVPYVFLRDQPYNRHYSEVPRFTGAPGAYHLISNAVEVWRQRQPHARK